MYTWLLGVLEREYETVRVLKETPRSSVCLIRHRALGEQLILRRFQGNGEVYRRLLGLACKNLPVIYEVAEQDGENLVLEEFIEGDTLDFLLQEALLSPKETRAVIIQLCRALWVLHSMGAVHRDVKPENVILRGRTRCSSTLTPPGFISRNRRRIPRSWALSALPPRSSTASPSPISAQTSTPWASS